jgi:hypothetical protein
MNFLTAVRLRRGDDVIEKVIPSAELYGKPHKVTEIEVDGKDRNVFIRCDDNRLYHHTALMPAPTKEG